MHQIRDRIITAIVCCVLCAGISGCSEKEPAQGGAAAVEEKAEPAKAGGTSTPTRARRCTWRTSA